MRGNGYDRLEAFAVFACGFRHFIHSDIEIAKTAPFGSGGKKSCDTVKDCEVEDTGDLWHKGCKGAAQGSVFCRQL